MFGAYYLHKLIAALIRDFVSKNPFEKGDLLAINERSDFVTTVIRSTPCFNLLLDLNGTLYKRKVRFDKNRIPYCLSLLGFKMRRFDFENGDDIIYQFDNLLNPKPNHTQLLMSLW
jgi:hypothetical protein